MASRYEVGRGKPPKHTRFKKGQSGNPNGRPPRKKLAARSEAANDFSKAILDEADSLLRMSTGRSIKEMSTREACIRKLKELGLKGDRRALERLLQFDQKAAQEQAAREGELSQQIFEFLQETRQIVADRRRRGLPDHPGINAFPHPEDVVLHEGQYVVVGPTSEDAAKLFGAAACYFHNGVADLMGGDGGAPLSTFERSCEVEEQFGSIGKRLPRRYRDPEWYDLNVDISWKDLARLFDVELATVSSSLRAGYQSMAVRRFSDRTSHSTQ